MAHYCLMSAAGSYTDFHADFGGSSVWYHVLRGRKVFLLIPPTVPNFVQYQRWYAEGRTDAFLPERVNGCVRVEVLAGHTLLIPTVCTWGVATSYVCMGGRGCGCVHV